jgi:hypothetical protein
MIFWFAELAVIFSVCAFALRMGGTPERIAGGWLLANVSLYTLMLVFENASPTLSLVNDGIFSIGLLPLAMIYVSRGVGLMTLIQAISFAVQAYYLLQDRPIDQTYLWLTNLACFGVVSTLLAATISVLMRQRRGGPRQFLRLPNASGERLPPKPPQTLQT